MLATATMDAPPVAAAVAAPRAADLELASRALEGDRRALSQIYETHRAGVGRHLLTLTHDRAAVDDLVQETFLTAFGQLDRFDGRSRLSTWLHGIAMNLARNHTAKHRRRGGLLDQMAPPAEVAEGADANARREEALTMLYETLDELSADQREAFVVRVIQQRPLKEASELLGAPVATVSYRARQAETHVKQRLRERGIES